MRTAYATVLFMMSTMKSLVSLLVTTALLCWTAQAVHAHEFWISPKSYQVEPGEPLVANLRVGEKFKGSAYAYISSNFSRFEIVMGEASLPVDGRLGDTPAMNVNVPGTGLAVVVHQTTEDVVTYNDWGKFESFVEEKALDGVLERHATRGFPEGKFEESFRRFAKSLIAVGLGDGRDRRVGLEIELVAGMNPYTDDVRSGFPVTLYYQDAPLPNARVTVFSRPIAEEVAVQTYETDENGRAVVAVLPSTEYLIDSVVMRDEIAPGLSRTSVWESLWASLTFHTPPLP